MAAMELSRYSFLPRQVDRAADWALLLICVAYFYDCEKRAPIIERLPYRTCPPLLVYQVDRCSECTLKIFLFTSIFAETSQYI